MIDLRVSNVSKRYRVRGQSSGNTGGFRAKLRRFEKSKEFWAVRDLSFEVQRGESLGIIGHNGAGKSTVLKLLSRITAPTSGRITIEGRIGALLEVGSGFHPELTGRENAYLSGSLLGMRRQEIAKKLDSIIDFAGVESFIDVPVKRYSSGMYVRLGFSVAVHLKPDILLLDEVLAVGDASFQEKCKKYILSLHDQGMTVVFISHDLTAVQKVCQRAILLERGQLTAEGTPTEVIRHYTSKTGFNPKIRGEGERRIAEIVNARFYDEQGDPATSFSTGNYLRVQVDYVAHQTISAAAVAVYFLSMDGEVEAQFASPAPGFEMKQGKGTAEFWCRELGLQPGVYQVDLCIEDGVTKRGYEWQPGCCFIHVEPFVRLRGKFYMPHASRLLNQADEGSSKDAEDQVLIR